MQPDQAAFLLSLELPVLEEEYKTSRKVLAAIPEERRDYRPDPKSKNARDLAWHIASSEAWFLDGIAAGAFANEEGGMPATVNTVADVVNWYTENLPPRIEKLKSLPASKLAEPISFYGLLNLPAVAYLSILVRHSVHHRGQLSTYLRPMGGKVPSIYGGSADEPFQMPAQP